MAPRYTLARVNMQCSDGNYVTAELEKSLHKMYKIILQYQSDYNESSAFIAQDFPPLFPRQASAVLPLRARSEEEAPDQKQSHRKLVCQNVYRGKGRCNIWHTLQSHRLVKDLTSWASGFANIRSRSVCREGPQTRIGSDSHNVMTPLSLISSFCFVGASSSS